MLLNLICKSSVDNETQSYKKIVHRVHFLKNLFQLNIKVP
jgi:hypothetical protein